MDYDPTKRIKYSHLTNNCLAYKYKNLHQSGQKDKNQGQSPEKFIDGEAYTSDNEDDDDEVFENIWSVKDFEAQLKKDLS